MVFLQYDGTFLVYQGDPLPERLIRETDEADTLALAWGTERYPWLSALFPSRPCRDAAGCARGSSRPVVRLNATLAFAVERQVVGQTDADFE
jgi:hypothetical protein